LLVSVVPTGTIEDRDRPVLPVRRKVLPVPTPIPGAALPCGRPIPAAASFRSRRTSARHADVLARSWACHW